MPGMYPAGEYDLAGFAVGVVEKDRVIDGSTIVAGDAVLGLASSGAHSNGYSLIRRILAKSKVDLLAPVGGRPLQDVIMEPTRIYAKPLLQLCESIAVKGLAHITGGGLLENVPRVLPGQLTAHIERGTWPVPALFEWLREQGNVADHEMLRVFNCGIGMVAVVAAADASAALDILRGAGETAWRIGTIRARADDEPQTAVA
jgi:phosphoribosylformylglycinamidine cyclo-ligase